MNIQDALKKAKECNMAIKMRDWPVKEYICQTRDRFGHITIGRFALVFTFTPELLMSDDWIVTSQHPFSEDAAK
jgi:hypothetical protein